MQPEKLQIDLEESPQEENGASETAADGDRKAGTVKNDDDPMAAGKGIIAGAVVGLLLWGGLALVWLMM